MVLPTKVEVQQDTGSLPVEAERGQWVDLAHLLEEQRPEYVAAAKVYMPFILHHFISCGWGPCYLTLHSKVLIPHLTCFAT